MNSAAIGKRLGLFGGTFDPIHLGHLLLAERARETLALDQVLFMPARIPPHKLHQAITPGPVRLEMIRLAIAENPAFAVSGLELARQGPSYTVDTLRSLRAQGPDDQLYLLVGSDTLRELPTWHAPESIARLARIAVARRPGEPIVELPPVPAGDKLVPWTMAEHVIEMPLIELSGRELRERVRSGRSIRYAVASSVEAYILANGLYRMERDAV